MQKFMKNLLKFDKIWLKFPPNAAAAEAPAGGRGAAPGGARRRGEARFPGEKDAAE